MVPWAILSLFCVATLPLAAQEEASDACFDLHFLFVSADSETEVPKLVGQGAWRMTLTPPLRHAEKGETVGVVDPEIKKLEISRHSTRRLETDAFSIYLRVRSRRSTTSQRDPWDGQPRLLDAGEVRRTDFGRRVRGNRYILVLPTPEPREPLSMWRSEDYVTRIARIAGISRPSWPIEDCLHRLPLVQLLDPPDRDQLLRVLDDAPPPSLPRGNTQQLHHAVRLAAGDWTALDHFESGTDPRFARAPLTLAFHQAPTPELKGRAGWLAVRMGMTSLATDVDRALTDGSAALDVDPSEKAKRRAWIAELAAYRHTAGCYVAIVAGALGLFAAVLATRRVGTWLMSR